MATLVFSTIGTVLGGPVGSAIGALIGQSIDQEILAPTRRGPRVGDLSVQTSSYGTQIPRIYGTMRVAGSVVWSTDLTEHSQTDGAKGQPDVTYSYTVSMAVALSSRSARSVKRIWADGKLLRGAADDFKVGTTFRFHDGGEDQAIDPLIGSVEGIANTPAYRGLALAVFEDLELAEFGNRIPFLTFEIEADEDAPALGSVLMDASGGAISCDADQTLGGFAAYGRSIKNAVEPLEESYGLDLFDDGIVARTPDGNAPISIGDDELGNSADKDLTSRFQREQLSARSLPAALRLTYYDPARDYQTGEARAFAGELNGNETQQELAVVITASVAKSLAQQVLARTWANRDKLTLRLPPNRLALEPGSILELAFSPSVWTVQKLTVDGFVVIAELRPSASLNFAASGDGGRIVPNADIVEGPLSLALIDVPYPSAQSLSGPTVLLAASTPSGWRRRTVELSFAGQSIIAQTARSKSVLGNAVTVLATGATDLLDEENSVDVQLVDHDQWLASCDNDALTAGQNLAALGSELIQFGEAVPLGSGQFRLNRLLRGRGGTEWACHGHGAGDVFCLVAPTTLQPITLPSWTIGAMVTASGGSAEASVGFAAESLRPPSPVNLTADRLANGDLVIGWTRRSRLGFAWTDGVDAPLGESREQYRVSISGSSGSVEAVVEQPSATVAASGVLSLGVGVATIEVRQVGDQAVSRPGQLSINPS